MRQNERALERLQAMTPARRSRSSTETVRGLELADFLLIAEAVLGVPAKRVAEESSLHLADSALHAPLACFGGEDFYPEFAVKAAVLCAHLVKNHPLQRRQRAGRPRGHDRVLPAQRPPVAAAAG